MPKPQNIEGLIKSIREIILEARSVVTGTVNYVTIIQNWEIGRMIVEEEQKGKARAEYGKNIITELSKKLTDEFGSSYNTSNLKRYRQFYLTFPINATVRRESQTSENKDIGNGAMVQHFFHQEKSKITLDKYLVLNDSKQVFASKYMLYLPSEEEIRKEIEYQKHQLKIENNL
jgi:hypothetical protein